MRLRFAPSPTGFLHVGGARTALFNWLLARASGGAFLLRIEDTDRNRSRPEHVRAILDGLSWLGLDPDEEPVFQAGGLERHRRDALRLLAEGKAYRDFTSPSDFAAARDEAMRSSPDTVTRLARSLASETPPDEARRRADAGEPFAIRFLVPDGVTEWRDGVHGATRFDNAEIEDLVLLRSDGTPTYNLAVVSDDAEMAITHVVRGDDHLSNTPKQILLYRALGLAVPEFAHLPLILGPDGRRLSKRHGAQSVGAFEEEGVLPEALFNFLALLGWSPGTDEEILSRDQLVRRFSLERVLRKGSVFDHGKLFWMNGQYLARMEPDALAELLVRRIEGADADARGEPGGSPDGGSGTGRDGSADAGPAIPLDASALRLLAKALAPRSRTLAEMADLARPYVGPVREYDAKAARKIWRRDPDAAAATLEAVRAVLADANWEAPALEAALRGLAAERGVGAGKVFQPLRLALTGLAASPGIFDVLLILGRERSLRRIQRAADHLRGPTGGRPGVAETPSEA